MYLYGRIRPRTSTSSWREAAIPRTSVVQRHAFEKTASSSRPDGHGRTSRRCPSGLPGNATGAPANDARRGEHQSRRRSQMERRCWSAFGEDDPRGRGLLRHLGGSARGLASAKPKPAPDLAGGRRPCRARHRGHVSDVLRSVRPPSSPVAWGSIDAPAARSVAACPSGNARS
jgi:hypothetical protein